MCCGWESDLWLNLKWGFSLAKGCGWLRDADERSAASTSGFAEPGQAYAGDALLWDDRLHRHARCALPASA